MRAKPYAPSTRPLRLEDAALNFSVTVGALFDHMIPTLQLPPPDPKTDPKTGPPGLRDPRDPRDPRLRPQDRAAAATDDSLPAGVVTTERLVRAVSKFDLSHNAPMKDKVRHVSDQEAKATLRSILHGDPTMDRMLHQLRQMLDYEPMAGAGARGVAEGAGAGLAGTLATLAEAQSGAARLLEQFTKEVDIALGKFWTKGAAGSARG